MPSASLSRMADMPKSAMRTSGGLCSENKMFAGCGGAGKAWVRRAWCQRAAARPGAHLQVAVDDIDGVQLDQALRDAQHDADLGDAGGAALEVR